MHTVVRASVKTTLVRSNGEERTVRVVSEPSGSSIDLRAILRNNLGKNRSISDAVVKDGGGA